MVVFKISHLDVTMAFKSRGKKLTLEEYSIVADIMGAQFMNQLAGYEDLYKQWWNNAVQKPA